jgi:transmembrane sensor
MSANHERLRDLIAEQAADWFMANRGEPSVREREDFADWLKASPLHVEEYLGIAAIARELPEAGSASESSIDSIVDRARAAENEPIRPLWPRIPETTRDSVLSRWRTAAVTFAAFAMLSIGLLAWWNFGRASRGLAPDTIATLHFQTQHGEQQTRRLPDGSILHLNTDTAVAISYSKSERIVMLTSGEADFEVAHEPKRPFRVFAGSAEVVDIGTHFDVRLERHSTLITVIEGRAAVGPSSMLRAQGTSVSQELLALFVELHADQQISVAQGVWPAAPIAVDAHRTTSWLRHQIMFDHEPLSLVATEFNRYASKPIEITTPALGDLKISGVFTTDDTDGFIAFLRSLEGVHVEVTATRIRVSRD